MHRNAHRIRGLKTSSTVGQRWGRGVGPDMEKPGVAVLRASGLLKSMSLIQVQNETRQQSSVDVGSVGVAKRDAVFDYAGELDGE
jgi:hypothetical protein